MQDFSVSVPIVTFDPNADLAENEIRTRMGYLAGDCLRALELALQDPSPTSMGRALHFTADVVCSGGYTLWKRFCHEYAIDHIGLASLKIFPYLVARFKELDQEYERLPSESFYGNDGLQRRLGEVILVLQQSARRGKAKWPSVGPETHKNSAWLSGVRRAPTAAAVQKLWIRSSDLVELAVAANEMLYACKEGAFERALFWLKWAHDEDLALKKETGGGLTNSDHGIAVSTKGKGRATPVNFLFLCAIEYYKELSAAGGPLSRTPQSAGLHDEVKAIFNLYTQAPTSLLTGRKRMELLVIMLQLLCEVPKWKIVAAPPVVKDALQMTRATQEAPKFFREILARPEPRKIIKKQPKPKKKKGEGLLTTDAKLNALDALANQYYGLPTGGIGGR